MGIIKEGVLPEAGSIIRTLTVSSSRGVGNGLESRTLSLESCRISGPRIPYTLLEIFIRISVVSTISLNLV